MKGNKILKYYITLSCILLFVYAIAAVYILTMAWLGGGATMVDISQYKEGTLEVLISWFFVPGFIYCAVNAVKTL